MCLNDTKRGNINLKQFQFPEFRVIDICTMNEEKYITIKELAELKGVSTRAIRLSKGKYITREITVKGGKSFEILLSSIEPELQEKYYSKLVLIPPIKQLPIIADFHKPDKAKIIALARFNLVNLWKDQRKPWCKPTTVSVTIRSLCLERCRKCLENARNAAAM